MDIRIGLVGFLIVGENSGMISLARSFVGFSLVRCVAENSCFECRFRFI